jgi:hypothetical protein
MAGEHDRGGVLQAAASTVVASGDGAVGGAELGVGAIVRLGLTMGLVPSFSMSASLVSFFAVSWWMRPLCRCGVPTRAFTRQENSVRTELSFLLGGRMTKLR